MLVRSFVYCVSFLLYKVVVLILLGFWVVVLGIGIIIRYFIIYFVGVFYIILGLFGFVIDILWIKIYEL